MSLDLIWKHQQETYENMKKQLEVTHSAAYVYPTGCGKSFPVLKYLDENRDKTAIILAPTVEILSQYSDYIQKYIMKSDEPIRSEFPNLRFITYQGLLRRNADKMKADIIISDELHRVGGEEWGKAFETLLANNPEADKIGITATPERTDGRNMIDEHFENDIVYEFSKIDALSGDKTGEVVLRPSTYVRVLSELKLLFSEYKKKIDRLPKSSEKSALLERFERFRQTVGSAESLKDTFTKNMINKNGKYIVFCKDEEDLQEAMKEAEKWFDGVNPDMYIDYVYSGNVSLDLRKTNRKNRETMDEFKRPSPENQNKLKLLFCVNKLNEGLHVDGISGVIMLRPTDSSIVWEQQIGRAFITVDKNVEKTVIIDVANNWLKFIDRYKDYLEGIERGKNRRGGKSLEEDKEYNSYQLAGEEIELLELLREIDRANGKSSVAETLSVAQILKDNGVDLSKIQLSKRIDEHTMHYFLLSEIKQDGIDINKIIEENDLDPEFPYGEKVKQLRRAYNGNRKDIAITEQDKKRAEELGLIIKDKKRLIETLEISEILKFYGVDFNKIQLSERITPTKRHHRTLSEIKQDGIDINKIIEENNLDPEFPFGYKIIQLRNLYNSEFLPEDIKRTVEDLGLVDLERDKRHPYLRLLETIRDWQESNNRKDLPRTKAHPINEEEEFEDDLAKRIGALKGYIKKKEGTNLSEEEARILKGAEELRITEKEKHPYLKLLEEIQEWQRVNETKRFPQALNKERKLPPEARSPEYALGKKLENLRNTFLKKYKDLTDEEFFELSEDEQQIIMICAQMGIGDKKNELIQRMRGYVTENVETNSAIRAELMQRVKEFRDESSKGEIKQ